jgi:hypothetical protein
LFAKKKNRQFFIIFLGKKIFGEKIFYKQNHFSGKNIFLAKIFFRQEYFSGESIFGEKYFLGECIFRVYF